MRLPLLALLALSFSASRAAAHAFQTGAESYAAFLEGVRVPLNDPLILLALVATGLMIGLWARDGMPRVWLGLLAGLIAGLALAPLAPQGVGLVALALAVVAAVLAAAAQRWPFALMLLLVTATGAATGLTALEGHGWGELPLTIALGVFFGVNMALVVPAGLVAFSSDLIKADWLRIGWRVAASWVGAISVMLAALQLT